ncbi:hypothetical protein O6H91_07G116900 [Diphasiastrum complanatum]|uniref:Uncharacterized protein n=1 Tax=Diphasiastrum complanatum TaxID=34168 RepID=A0ACC2D956_DIPCM|nr:hypothetical protein O6H91_07G116900 [Diphasiastrum complanatum]
MAPITSTSTSLLCSSTIEIFLLTGSSAQNSSRVKRGFTMAPSCQITTHKTLLCKNSGEVLLCRREAMKIAMLAALPLVESLKSDSACGASLPAPEPKKLCDDDCEKELEKIPMNKTESGLQYKDIVIGNGPTPPIGFQVAANYVAMVPSGKVFDSSLDKGVPYIFRVGAGQVVKGLDEGILSMKVGGKRRLYIPGELAFPKGLGAAAGRPRVPPSSPVIFDVSLEYVPGIDDFETD